MNKTETIAFAPTRIKWITHRGSRHLPFFGGILQKRDTAKLLLLAQASAEKKIQFLVKDSGWARKQVPFDGASVRNSLMEIDKTMGLNVGDNILQSEHWSRTYEYPYAAYELSNVPKDGKILDCGCGLSSFQFYLAEQGFKVHSLDYDMRTLRQLAALKTRSGLNNLKPTFGSVLKLPFSSEYFDGAVCISVLEHVIISPETSSFIIKGAINEMLRVLRKGGVLVLTFDVNFGKEQRSLKPNEYAELCSMLGIETESLPRDRLYSSDTKEGLLMGQDLAVYSITMMRY